MRMTVEMVLEMTSCPSVLHLETAKERN